MPDPLATINTRRTPQREAARADQAENNAGGFVFTLSPRQQARRFLILGTDGGTYYQGEKELTKSNAAVVIAMARDDGHALLEEVADVSMRGLAKKQNPALFALAAAAGSPDPTVRAAAAELIPAVCRTGTMLFTFAGYAEQFRGWGRGLRRGVAKWYIDKPVDALALQLVKYRQRNGWTHRDLLRLAHPATTAPADAARRAAFAWATHGQLPDGFAELGVIDGYTAVQTATGAKEAARIVEGYRLPWEAVPDQFLASPDVWAALLPSMGQTALIRQLARMTANGLIAPMGATTTQIAGMICDQDRLRKGRVHPLAVLLALTTYRAGHGQKGSLRWQPAGPIVDALDDAFYLAFENVEPANKRTMLALDVSGSMGSLIGGSFLSAREASAAMAMVTVRTEPAYFVTGFTAGTYQTRHAGYPVGLIDLAITARQRLDDVVRYTSGLPFGGTDCALPMLAALERKVEVDTFVVYTDNETWAGQVHPFQALRQYREKMGIPARLVVVGMTATEFSIADPKDPGMLDVVGFDASAPALISEFSRGDV